MTATRAEGAGPALSSHAHVWTLALPDEEATQALARDLAPALRPEDLITLSGDLGAGKTAFARALIRTLTGDPTLEVPSPSFTLIQVYEGPQSPIVHADLYRLNSADELVGIGWDEAADGAILLVEWPDRAGDALPAERLDIALTLDIPNGVNARQAVLTGTGSWATRLPRLAAIGAFLRSTGWETAERRFMLGDASVRAYERLTRGNQSAILMNAPTRPGGMPIRFGRTYADLAHIAISVTPFVAMAGGLAAQGLSAPAILGADLAEGLLLIEDFGNLGVVDKAGPIPERYSAAIDVLIALHAADLPYRLPVPGATDYPIPFFDRPALEIEVEQLLDWYFPQMGLPSASQRVRDAFLSAWRDPFERILTGPKTWLLRDFHSPNLMWLPEREGLQRIGLLDFQDAMIGSPAYDVASLTMDARATVSEALELSLVSRYVMGRRRIDAGFDAAGFARDYAIMGAQRLTKILGIFARLNLRDGKPHYLRHLPRVRTYLERALAHPVLADVKAWYDTHVFQTVSQELPHDG